MNCKPVICKPRFTISKMIHKCITYAFLRKKEELKPTCSICLCDVHDNTATLSCGHIYCKECIKSWIVKNQSCPNCRKKLEWIEVYQLFKTKEQIERDRRKTEVLLAMDILINKKK